ncbi:MAG: CoA pyrophosphatase [Bdellovibrionales bacterium]|nr:CoA pyrophosphatase [Bdellovibrionales bacterium]
MTGPFTNRYREADERLRKAAAFDLPYPFRTESEGRPAAVLVLAGLREDGGGLELLITRRTESIATHKGQYALPGGMRDADAETAEATALREAREEVGVAEGDVETLGRLPAIWTPSGFSITPVIGLLKRSIEEIEIRPSVEEIDLWFWCPISRLREAGVYRSETREIVYQGASRTVPVDVYLVDTHRIWGATGAILRNFLTRLERVESDPGFG